MAQLAERLLGKEQVEGSNPSRGFPGRTMPQPGPTGRVPPTGSPAVVRPARPTDAKRIAAIYNQSVASSTATFDTEPRSVGLQRRLIREHGDRLPMLVAERGGDVVGWASLSPWSPRRAYARTAETSIYVDEMAQGQGVGRLLIERLLGLARTSGLHTLLARISAESVPSLRLHLSEGFRRVGVMHEVGFKFGRWLDVDLLERRIPPRAAASRTGASRQRPRTPRPTRTGRRSVRRRR